MIESYVQEFIEITKHLKKRQDTIKRGEFLLSTRETVTNLLNKNMYDTADNKLKIWRGLRWIDTDPQRVTRRIYGIYENGKPIPMIKINLRIYQVLSKIVEEGS